MLKIRGQSPTELSRGVARIPKPGGELELEVQAYPLGRDEDAWLPFPRPPKRAARKRNGKILRDETGQPIFELDEQDEQYKTLRDRIFWLRMAANFYDAVKPCGEVEFDADKKGLDRDKAPEAFFEAVLQDLQGSGFSTGDVIIVVAKAREISNLGDLEAAAENFSSPGPEPEESPDSLDA